MNIFTFLAIYLIVDLLNHYLVKPLYMKFFPISQIPHYARLAQIDFRQCDKALLKLKSKDINKYNKVIDALKESNINFVYK